ncbi:ABC transporter ATP-binding protein [Trueperella sp. LYQ143]|uniref:ABC transporter ATP-binding protein n=1 Tax=unclassified Trueperella TaxID=2630174 RepID=UPI0039834EF2
MSVTISIDNVTKRFGNDTVIDGLSLSINPGEFFTLLGPSGCGKTTLLRMIIGFNSIDGGQITVDGKVINNVPINKRNMGMVFQNYAVFPHLSVKENVGFGLQMRKTAKKEAAQAIEKILDTVKISQLAERMPAKLSGGQQQRVALARALVIEPQVLLMDEPLSNLDAKLRVEMRNAIKEIQHSVGITTVYVTHDQEEALAVSDRIAVMNGGVIQQVGTPQEIYRRPANTFVATFIGLSNLLSAQRIGEKIRISEGYEVSVPGLDPQGDSSSDSQNVTVSVRPEEFLIVTENDAAGLPATVISSVFLGTSTHYFLELPDGQHVEVIRDDDTAAPIPAGTPVKLQVRAHKINVFTADGQRNLTRGN